MQNRADDRAENQRQKYPFGKGNGKKQNSAGR
jgi:hypothetical protein